MARTYADIASLIVGRIPRPNPIVGGIVVADLGLVNGTQMVTVLTGGATRQAVYLAPLAVQVGGNVFVTRLGQELTAGLAVVTTNYQVLGDGAWGSGSRPWGTGSGVWGV